MKRLVREIEVIFEDYECVTKELNELSEKYREIDPMDIIGVVNIEPDEPVRIDFEPLIVGGQCIQKIWQIRDKLYHHWASKLAELVKREGKEKVAEALKQCWKEEW